MGHIKVYFCSKLMFRRGGHFSFNRGLRGSVLPFCGSTVFVQSLTSKMLSCRKPQERKNAEENAGEGFRRSPGSDNAASFLFTFLAATQSCQGNGTSLCDQEAGDEVWGTPARLPRGCKSRTMARPRHFSPAR